MELYLVRHAPTAWNREGRRQGSQDIPLSDEGREQARRRRSFMRPLLQPGTLVYSSPLSRASETAAILFDPWPIQIDPRLSELNYGLWEGLTKRTIRAEYGHAFWQSMMQDPEARAPQGESFAECLERSADFWRDVVQDDPERLIVIGHGVALRALLLAVVPKLPRTLWTDLILDNLSLSKLEVDGSWVRIALWNAPGPIPCDHA